MGIGLIELTEPSDTLNYKAILNIAFYELFYLYFYCLYFCGTKSSVLKTGLISYFFDLVWASIRCYSIRYSVFLDVLAAADVICL